MKHTLPNLIQNYCNRAKVDHSAALCNIQLRQQGKIRLGPHKPWMPFSATQMISSNKVAFRWRAKFRMAGFLPGTVVDCFEGDRGKLDAWLFGFLRVAHARGPEVDRSEAQRYLAELAWCPMAFANNSVLKFEELSPASIRVSAYDNETYVDLVFDDRGDICGTRTLTRSRGTVIQPWEGRFSDYQELGGIRLPTFGEVWWDDPQGRFVYWRASLTAIELVQAGDG